MDIYVWEQYKALPVPSCAEIQYLPRCDRNETNLVILFRHEQSLLSFRDYRDRISCNCGTEDSTDQVWSCSSEVFLSICALFQVIVFETTRFLEGASVEMEKMVS